MLKSEIRRPKAERSPKVEGRNPNALDHLDAVSEGSLFARTHDEPRTFGLRASAFCPLITDYCNTEN
jgi:hypothetical protein